MSWFKVDDGFADHPKVVELQESPGWKGALALWTLAGSWSSRHLTDGHVPAAIVKRLGCTPKDARMLVSAGLWLDAEGGYRFHDYTDCNPTRDEVEAKREATRKRVSKHREKRDCNALQVDRCNTSPVPTRPDPSQEHPSGAARAREVGDFERLALVVHALGHAGLDPIASGMLRQATPRIHELGGEPWLRAAWERFQAHPDTRKRRLRAKHFLEDLDHWADASSVSTDFAPARGAHAAEGDMNADWMAE